MKQFGYSFPIDFCPQTRRWQNTWWNLWFQWTLTFFWKGSTLKYLNLSKVANQYLCVTATSAPVERIFSIVRKLFRPDQCNLKDKCFENLIFVKGNYMHVWQINGLKQFEVDFQLWFLKLQWKNCNITGCLLTIKF